MIASAGTIVLDAQGLAGWLTDDPRVLQAMKFAFRKQVRVVTSAMTILEVSYGKLDARRLDWVLSQVLIEPVTEASARAASRRMIRAGVHGHSHAIDAVVAELASRQQRPVAVLTSDPDDLGRLCDPHVRVVRV